MQLVSTKNKKFLLEPIVKNRNFGKKEKENQGKRSYLFRNEMMQMAYMGADLIIESQDEIDY